MTSVAQIGTDRIIELQFSDGQYRLFLEFYAGGNIILTDRDFSIINLLRIVHEETEELRVGLRYPLDNRQNYGGVPQLTWERVQTGLQIAINKAEVDAAIPQKKLKRKPADALRKALATSLNEFPPILIDHALKVATFDSSIPVDTVLKCPSIMEKLMTALEEAQKVLDRVSDSERCSGYIICKPVKTTLISERVDEKEESVRTTFMYDDFHPFRPQQFERIPEIRILEYNGFNKTVDQFFSSIESQKLESRLTEREDHAKRKLENARQDHEKRLGGLQQVQEMNVRKAQAIEGNLQKVQEAIAAVNGLLAQGMDWMDVARLIEMEQEKHNVVAEMIKLPLKLYENSVTLLLAEATYEEDDDYSGEETCSDVSDSESGQIASERSANAPKLADKRLAVDIDLALSAWANARQYYDEKKLAVVKEQKTLQSSEKALKSTEKKINADLRKGLKQEKEIMRPQRKALWFEKFVYFISSEGYLVLGGKDGQQNEILYKRYLKRGDVYIHADLIGAASVIVKNKPSMWNNPIPPSTLSQAGTLAVATSSAWDSKAVMSAWWVNADQVSKMAHSGEYLNVGDFTVRGQKNFLPPAQLLLGFGIMFKISEGSKARHHKYRVQEDRPSEAPPRGKKSNENFPGMGEDSGIGHGKHKDNDALIQSESESIAATEESGTNVSDSNSGSDEDDLDHDEVSEISIPLRPKESPQIIPQPLKRNNSECDPQPDHRRSYHILQPREDDVEQSRGQIEPSSALQNDQERRLSAEERQGLKDNPSLTNNDPLRIAQIASTITNSRNDQLKERPSQQPRVRGKQGKRNKVKSKYGDQDEEDRALAMRLLGTAAAQEKVARKADNNVAKEQEFAAQKERRRKQHAMAAEKGREAEEFRKMAFEAGGDALDESEMQELSDIDAFIGAPLPGDNILDALVVCGPWDAIGGRCRWRVKLQPGATKKGKAVREILHTWVSAIADREKRERLGSGEGNETMMEEEKVRSREAELIKALREPEIIGLVPVGKVRVVMGTGEGGGKKGEGAGKGKRGGKGSKRQR